MEHTPTPWHRNAYNLSSLIKINDGADENGHTYIDGRHQVKIASFTTVTDAAFAERAVNCHEELVNMLKNLHPTIADDLMRASVGNLIIQAEGK